MKHLLARLSCCFSSLLYKGRGRRFKVKGVEGIGVLFTVVVRVEFTIRRVRALRASIALKDWLYILYCFVNSWTEISLLK